MHTDPAGTVQCKNGAERCPLVRFSCRCAMSSFSRIWEQTCKRDHQPTSQVFKIMEFFNIWVI